MLFLGKYSLRKRFLIAGAGILLAMIVSGFVWNEARNCIPMFKFWTRDYGAERDHPAEYRFVFEISKRNPFR
jgi:hypothetical protein